MLPDAVSAQTVLVLEADDAQRVSLIDLLQLAGYQVLAAATGPAGLELTRQRPPHLLLCAAQLPGLDGYGLLHVLRQTPSLRQLPVIMMGPGTAWGDVRRAMELGADDYLPTPLVGGDLLRAVAARLLRHQPARPAAGDLAAEPAASNLLALVEGRPTHVVLRRQQLYGDGDEPRYLYYVQAGRVKTTKATSFGKELVTSFYQAGEFFGYKALLEQGPHHEAATTVEDSVLVYVPAAEFWQQLRHPDVSQQLVRLLAERKREREEVLLDMAYHSLRRRVANALLHLHEQARPATGQPAYILLAREDLAALIGITPESLSRTLSEFRQARLLKITPQGLLLLQPDYLREADW